MNDQNSEDRITVHVAPDLDYVYRDIVNIFVGQGDVILELGNRHRAMPDQVTISNRIVLSVATAQDLATRLEATLRDAQEKIQAQLRTQRQNRPTSG